MNYEFQIWINHQYDENLFQYQILKYMFDITLSNINNLGLDICNEEEFFNNFISFMYYHTNKKCKLMIPKIDERRNKFNDLYENNINDIACQIEDYLDSNAIKIFNDKNKKQNFVELVYNNLVFNLQDDLSEDEDDIVDESEYLYN